MSHVAPTFSTSMRSVVRGLFPVNLLIVFVPVGIAVGALNLVSPVWLFWINFAGIIPLAMLLGHATEDLALRTNVVTGGLLNATFGNAVELIVAIVALRMGLIRLVQTSLLGSIVSNLLFVTGFSFALGGIRYPEQRFSLRAADTSASMLTISAMSLILPAAFAASSHETASGSAGGSDAFSKGASTASMLSLSRGCSIILLIVYFCYLLFQLHTHVELFEPDSTQRSISAPASSASSATNAAARNAEGVQNSQTRRQAPCLAGGSTSMAAPVRVASSNLQAGSRACNSDRSCDDCESGNSDENHEAQQLLPNGLPSDVAVPQGPEEETPSMTVSFSIAMMIFATLCVSVCSEYMVASVEGLAQSWGLSHAFIGLILLPIVGDATEHLSAVTVAMKNKMDLSLAIAMGSSMQISIFLLPLTVLLGWAIDQPMTLHFQIFEIASLFVSVLIVNYLIHDGRSNWFEGVLLIATYVMIAISLYFYK